MIVVPTFGPRWSFQAVLVEPCIRNFRSSPRLMGYDPRTKGMLRNRILLFKAKSSVWYCFFVHHCVLLVDTIENCENVCLYDTTILTSVSGHLFVSSFSLSFHLFYLQSHYQILQYRLHLSTITSFHCPLCSSHRDIISVFDL